METSFLLHPGRLGPSDGWPPAGTSPTQEPSGDTRGPEGPPGAFRLRGLQAGALGRKVGSSWCFMAISGQHGNDGLAQGSDLNISGPQFPHL